MAERIGILVALRGGRLTADDRDSAARAAVNACWLVKVTDVLLSSGAFYGHGWLVPLPLLRALKESLIDTLCQGHPDLAACLRALLPRIEEAHHKSLASYLGLPDLPRGLVRCARSLTSDGALLMEKGLGHEGLP